MTDKELEKRISKLEADIRILKIGSNNPAILVSLQAALKDLQKRQEKIIAVLRKLADCLSKEKPVTNQALLPKKKPRL